MMFTNVYNSGENPLTYLLTLFTKQNKTKQNNTLTSLPVDLFTNVYETVNVYKCLQTPKIKPCLQMFTNP